MMVRELNVSGDDIYLRVTKEGHPSLTVLVVVKSLGDDMYEVKPDINIDNLTTAQIGSTPTITVINNKSETFNAGINIPLLNEHGTVLEKSLLYKSDYNIWEINAPLTIVPQDNTETLSGESLVPISMGKSNGVSGWYMIGSDNYLEIDSNTGGTLRTTDLEVKNNLNVTNATTLSSTLNVTHKSTLNTVTVNGKTELKNTDLVGKLDIVGVINQTGNLNVTGDAVVSSKITSNVGQINNNLTVGGISSLTSLVADSATVTGNATLEKTLEVKNTSNLADVVVGGVLNVNKNVSLKEQLVVGKSHLLSTMIVDKAVTLGDVLVVHGGNDFLNTMNVRGNVTMDSKLVVKDTIDISGASVLRSTLNVSKRTDLKETHTPL